MAGHVSILNTIVNIISFLLHYFMMCHLPYQTTFYDKMSTIISLFQPLYFILDVQLKCHPNKNAASTLY